MAAEPDAIVVGGGHNGLVAAAYLARAGYWASRRILADRRGPVSGSGDEEPPLAHL